MRASVISDTVNGLAANIVQRSIFNARDFSSLGRFNIVSQFFLYTESSSLGMAFTICCSFLLLLPSVS